MKKGVVWGYKRLICPNCIDGSNVSKRKGVYKVYETNTQIILTCIKCQFKINIEKKNKGKQQVVIRKW